MYKKIFLLLILIISVSACDYTAVHSNKENEIEIKITDTTGDTEINNYISKELKRKSKSSSEKIQIKINSNFSKRILAKDTKALLLIMN